MVVPGVKSQQRRFFRSPDCRRVVQVRRSIAARWVDHTCGGTGRCSRYGAPSVLEQFSNPLVKTTVTKTLRRRVRERGVVALEGVPGRQHGDTDVCEKKIPPQRERHLETCEVSIPSILAARRTRLVVLAKSAVSGRRQARPRSRRFRVPRRRSTSRRYASAPSVTLSTASAVLIDFFCCRCSDGCSSRCGDD
ncbi:hypothetical protein Mal15_17870 [Stieleria maiorica]|uniref:Uncharacterized protein n=1 Tax=Stieleria maiorica TaxID=2795974 RepID=A0A5B9MAN2_9BACT|nr:hypothetical protein Mal15_17870 [Stieleria maiorica]